MSLINIISEDKNYKLSYDTLKSIEDIFIEYGFQVENLTEKSYIESGLWSDVYRLNGGWVLKITHERFVKDDYIPLLDNDTKNVATVIFADKIPINTGRQFYGIIQEYVPDNIAEVKLLIERFTPELSYSSNLKLVRGIFNDFNTGEYSLSDFKNEYQKQLINKSEILKFITDVYNGIQELLSVGIIPEDVHFGNIRKDEEGNYKIIDF